jgi:hypothetical protein
MGSRWSAGQTRVLIPGQALGLVAAAAKALLAI